MKRIFLLLSLMIFAISCDTSDDDSGGINEEYIVHRNSELEIETLEFGTFVDIVPGNKLVFEYHLSKAADPDIADSGYDEYLYFELEEGTEDFRLIDEGISISRAYLRRSCFCIFTDFRPLTAGEIFGEKIGNNTWNINFDVEAAIEEDGEIVETIAIQNSGTFRPE